MLGLFSKKTEIGIFKNTLILGLFQKKVKKSQKKGQKSDPFWRF